MQISRRYLPPLGGLVAFEAVARCGSVTAAAGELDLTQGAVSRQIQKLEEFLNYQLFIREKKRLVLTPVGASYAEAVRAGLSSITNATLDLKSNPHGGVLELAILPAFGSYWLAPRLASFLSANPGISVNMSSRTEPFDFSRERFHAAIHFGRDNLRDVQSIKLMDEEVVPVMSRDLLEGRVPEPVDVTRLPLLYLESRANAWRNWFAQNNLGEQPQRGMIFDQFATLLQAAAAGLGVALMPKFLLTDPTRTENLVLMENAKMISTGAYYLVWPKAKATYPPLNAFREWIEAEFTSQRD